MPGGLLPTICVTVEVGCVMPGNEFGPGPRADLPIRFAFCRIGSHSWLDLLF